MSATLIGINQFLQSSRAPDRTKDASVSDVLSKLTGAQWHVNVPTIPVITPPPSTPNWLQLYCISFRQWSTVSEIYFSSSFIERFGKNWKFEIIDSTPGARSVLSSVMSESLIYTLQPLIMFLCSFSLCLSVALPSFVTRTHYLAESDTQRRRPTSLSVLPPPTPSSSGPQFS